MIKSISTTANSYASINFGMTKKGAGSNFRPDNNPAKNDAQKGQDKKKFPWGKFLLGAGITAGIVALVVKVDPRKCTKNNKFKKLFPSTKLNLDDIEAPRLFPNLPKKYEDIIVGAAKNGEVTKEALEELPKELNGEKLIEYAKETRQLKELSAKIAGGSLDGYQNGLAGDKVGETVNLISASQKNIKELYENFVRPLEGKKFDSMA